MGLSFFRDAVTILRAPLETRNGAEYRNWTHTASHTVEHVQVTAASTTRDYAGRTESTTDRRTLRANYDADIQEGDRVVYKGNLYEIDGEVFHTQSPTGRASSTRCALVRWKG
jgi:hypothetical protein